MSAIILVLAAVLGASVCRENSRAINSTGLWSKYNLIVRPEVSAAISTVAPQPKPRWEEEDEEVYGPEIHDDKEFEDSEEQEEEEEEEEDTGYTVHTTQRSKGDSGKKRRKPVRKVTRKDDIKKGQKKGYKAIKSLKKYMFPLLIAYKLKFFTLIPLLLGGLVLIVATTGFAGFFFALFAVGVGLKKD